MSTEWSLLPQINQNATMKRVKDALNLARDFILMGFYPAAEDDTSSMQSALVNDHHDIAKMRAEHVRKVVEAVNRLSKRERELIQTRWFADDDKTDIETYIELNMTHATYYRVRARAFYKLAHALQLAVFQEDDTYSGGNRVNTEIK